VTVGGMFVIFSQKLLISVAEANEFFESAPLVSEVEDFLRLEKTLIRPRPERKFVGTFDRIEVDEVGFTYHGADRAALDGVSLTVQAGEVVALVGENGSGKTTLAKLLAGLYFPQEGAIRIDGADLSEMDPASWRESVAVLFQDFIRYALPASDNIHLGAVTRDADLDLIREAARAADADGFLSALPEGYKTILSPQFGRGQDISLGQWQRVALARAFFRGAPLVILDEPSASLDARAERALFESVRELYRDRTVLLISHRFSTVRTADRIVVLSDGKIVEQGTHAELMAARGLYEELFTIQASGFIETDLEEVGSS
jgi:ATP-binding cassette subfamily B protein